MESGYHSEQWFELERLFVDPARLQPFVSELARRLAIHRIAAVCGPMSGGAKLAAAIAAELGVTYLFAERFETPAATGLFPIRYALPASSRAAAYGKSVAIVDDAISAGSAVRGTFASLLECGARPVAVGALLVFGDAAEQFATDKGIALASLVRMPFGMWPPAQCPLCKAGQPIERVAEI